MCKRGLRNFALSFAAVLMVVGAHVKLNGPGTHALTHQGTYVQDNWGYNRASWSKLTWLVLGEDPAARSHRVEQFTAL